MTLCKLEVLNSLMKAKYSAYMFCTLSDKHLYTETVAWFTRLLCNYVHN